MKILQSAIFSDIRLGTRHNHPCWELVYKLSGGSDVTVGDAIFHTCAGDLYLVPPEVFHCDSTKSSFSDLVLLVDEINPDKPHLVHDYDGSILSTMQIINRVMNQKGEGYQGIADSFGEALLRYISPFLTSSKKSGFVYSLKNLIFENVGNADFDLTEEIKKLNYNPDHIRRCFKAETGKTPLSYLTDLRIDRAKQLLVSPTYETVETVSAKCGFRDSFYFSTCFKKRIGCSPLQYRRQAQ